MRWRKQDARSVHEGAALPAVVVGVAGDGRGAVLAGVREPLPRGWCSAPASRWPRTWSVTVRGFRAGWKHGVAFLGTPAWRCC